MKFPKTVKVGAHDYKIILAKELQDQAGTTYYGLHNFSKLEISLVTTVPTAVMLETFLHEVTHGLLEHYHIKQNEKIVDCMARGFLMLMRDNPKLFQDILEELK